MQTLGYEETIKNIKKSKSEIKKELQELIANIKRNENAEMQEKINRCTPNEDAVKVIQEFERIIKKKKNDIVWLVYYQGQIFPKIKEKECFVSMVLKLNVSKSTITFKNALSRL